MALDPSPITPTASILPAMAMPFEQVAIEDVRDEAELWKLLREHGDEGARQKLLELHMPYARIVAKTYYGRRMNDEIEYGDYLQLASIGLIEALDRFDPGRGFHFRSYAAHRIQGAILDGLEHLTEKHEQIAARQRLEARRSLIKDSAGYQPGRSRTPEQMLQFVAEAGLSFALAWILDGTAMLQAEEKAENLPFYRSIELQQLRKRIVEIVQSLPAQEKRVIHSHYFQEVEFDEIASTMRLSRGRISQLHRQALLHLKEGLRPCDVSW